MSKTLHFWKMNGAGNDFVMLDKSRFGPVVEQ
jgi:diaminopimelate epimerase